MKYQPGGIRGTHSPLATPYKLPYCQGQNPKYPPGFQMWVLFKNI